MTRDEYVAKLKERLDTWHEQVSRWEAHAGKLRGEAKDRFALELEVLKAQRDVARYNLKILELASANAWTELRAGADEAWDRMHAAMNRASAWFEKG